MQQANGKRSFKFTKASQAQPSTAKHSQTQPSTASTALHSPVQPCTALVIFSLSFRLPASLARPSFSFRSLFGRLLRLHGPRFIFAPFSAACFDFFSPFCLGYLFLLLPLLFAFALGICFCFCVLLSLLLLLSDFAVCCCFLFSSFYLAFAF